MSKLEAKIAVVTGGNSGFAGLLCFEGGTTDRLASGIGKSYGCPMAA